MIVKMVSATGRVLVTQGLVWYEDNDLIVNTKAVRYTFTQIRFVSVSEQLGTMLIELQGTTRVPSGTGDAPETYNITLQHG